MTVQGPKRRNSTQAFLGRTLFVRQERRCPVVQDEQVGFSGLHYGTPILFESRVGTEMGNGVRGASCTAPFLLRFVYI